MPPKDPTAQEVGLNNKENNETHRQKEQGPQGTVFVAPGDLPDLGEVGDGAGVTPDSPALVGLTPPFTDHWFRLEPGRTQIGRKDHNDIVLDEPSVSFEHARIVRSSGEWRVVNLLSTNGTFLNGEKVHQSRLSHGDRLAFGNAAFLFATSERVEPSNEAQSFQPQPANARQKWLAAALALAGLLVIGLLIWFL